LSVPASTAAGRATFDRLTPDRVLPLLRGRLGRPYTYVSSCSSTQALLRGELPEGACAVAEHQTAGRGRRGRTWHAPGGEALLVSVLLRPPRHRPLPQVAIVAGLAVARTVEAATGRAARVKWPNDVLVDGRKVAGILAEASGDAVALGIGMNVNQTEDALPVRSAFPAASLRSLDGVVRDRAPLLAALLLDLAAVYDAWIDGGLDRLAGELRARDALRGLEVVAGSTTGFADGIDGSGRLLVRTAGGVVAIGSGEVSVVSGRA
jgi:BirA family biotin operon repressor/biotin-[acetyl-CoA-carboxylase] ligase